jgi:hypothetical protein
MLDDCGMSREPVRRNRHHQIGYISRKHCMSNQVRVQLQIKSIYLGLSTDHGAIWGTMLLECQAARMAKQLASRNQ